MDLWHSPIPPFVLKRGWNTNCKRAMYTHTQRYFMHWYYFNHALLSRITVLTNCINGDSAPLALIARAVLKAPTAIHLTTCIIKRKPLNKELNHEKFWAAVLLISRALRFASNYIIKSRLCLYVCALVLNVVCCLPWYVGVQKSLCHRRIEYNRFALVHLLRCIVHRRKQGYSHCAPLGSSNDWRSIDHFPRTIYFVREIVSVVTGNLAPRGFWNPTRTFALCH